jgi:anhydro-N-acetylmuramic acid kinase
MAVKGEGTMAAEPIWALGAMSGTSLDGVDAAMVLTDGERIVEFGETGYRPYSAPERALIWAARGRWPGEAGVAEAAAVVDAAHAELLTGIEGAALVGFHGQTLSHRPEAGRTHQAGDGAALARRLGLPVVWDFRTQDMADGGQGAPLAPFFHFALARHIGATGRLAFLNLGGVGNLTWVDPAHPRPEDPGALLAFDTGPASAPLNDLMQARRGVPFDRDGALAASGRADAAMLARFAANPYFQRPPPKSLDRDDFADLAREVGALADADAAATLTAAVAEAVARAIPHCPAPPGRLLVTGGGRHNRQIMAEITRCLACPVEPVEAVGLDGDMLEAQAFAYLAVRVLRGLPTSAPGTTGVRAPVFGGRLSAP